ncbi:MAG: 4-(cytidine 5'-diphospho)-2-C-methyl-D-erythritol kinase [Acidaminobacteraceae bacterium]
MDKIIEHGRAKVNLTLDVTSKLPNGYHEVDMVMHQIDLYDVITINKNKVAKVRLQNSVKYLPTDKTNIAFKAAMIIRERYNIDEGVDIYIEKNIPVSAGMAGGSTDAASVIKGMNKLFDLNMSIDDMLGIGLQIGADVPFCILGGCYIARGIGEQLTPIDSKLESWLVVAKPNIGVSTREVYRNLDVDNIKNHPDTFKMQEAVESGNTYSVVKNLRNVLEDVTTKMHPIIFDIKSRMMEYGAIGEMMSGSGPTVFGFFKTKEKATRACANMKRKYPQSYVVRLYGKRNEL